MSTKREFYTFGKGKMPPAVTFKRTQKYKLKVLVSIGKTTCLDEFIGKRLISSISNHHLALSHYGKSITCYLHQNGIQSVSKHLNAQNCSINTESISLFECRNISEKKLMRRPELIWHPLYLGNMAVK